MQKNIKQLINKIGHSEKWNQRQSSFCMSFGLAEVISSVNAQISVAQIVNNFDNMEEHYHIGYCYDKRWHLLWS